MEVVEEASCPVVYVGGLKLGSHKQAWYRVDVESLKEGHVVECKRKKKKASYLKKCSAKHGPEKPKKIKTSRVKLNSAVQMNFGDHGSCAMIGDYIYWFGDNLHRAPSPCPMLLLKHDINDPNTSSWYIFSSSSTDHPPSCSIVVCPVGRKLYAFRGTNADEEECDQRRESNLCGEIYDLDSNTWKDLNYSISTCVGSYGAPYVALAENEDGDPKEILFYNLCEGSILFLDLSSGELRNDKDHRSLAVWDFRNTPLGLDDCGGLGNLIDSTRNGLPMLSNNTLYWFTYDLHLYGYDINLKRWFQSPSLAEQLPTLKPFLYWNVDIAFTPFLVNLRNGKFMVIVPESLGEFTVATLTVFRNENSLNVSVESFHPLCLDDPSFIPVAAMSMLKDTWSGSMYGLVGSALAF